MVLLGLLVAITLVTPLDGLGIRIALLLFLHADLRVLGLRVMRRPVDRVVIARSAFPAGCAVGGFGTKRRC